MSSKNTRDKIVTHTASKVIIKVDKAKEVLSETEIALFEKLIQKLKVAQ